MVPGKIAAGFFVCLLLSMATVRPVLAAVDAGQVLTLAGDCAAVADGRRTSLKTGDTVHVGDMLEVGDGAKLKLRMNDGSVLSLGAGAKMTIQDYEADAAGNRRDAKLNLDSGLLR